MLLLSPALAATEGTHEVVKHDITHRMMTLMLQLGAILFAARIGNLLFDRLKLPPVLGELCAGMVLGPYLLGGLPLPGFPQGLFAVVPGDGAGALPVSPELYGFSSLAAIVLLFMVGLETDLKLFLRYSLAGGLTGVGGVLVSCLAGAAAMSLAAPILLGHPLGLFSIQSLMVGVIFCATSVGISSRILAERKKLETPEGVTILAGAVVDDVLGVVMLAIVLGMASISGSQGAFPWRAVGTIAAKTSLFWLFATAVGLIAAHRIGAGLKMFRRRTVIAVMALGLALIVAGLFESVGLAMIVGAYVTGLSLSRTDLRHVIVEQLHGLHTMLVPVFFAVMGMLVDVRQFAQPKMLGFGVLFFVVAVLAKLLGCGLPPLLAGFNLRGAFRIGAGMIPRGEVTLLMTGAGLTAGLLAPDMLGVVVVMTLLSALAAPPFMMLAFRGLGRGTRHPIPPDHREQEMKFTFPTPAASNMLTLKLWSCFEYEGFYVHLLDRQQGLYQFRKDDSVIGCRVNDNDIVFQCREQDMAMVRTAMVEVAAELEQTLADLRKPLDLQALRDGLQMGTGATGPVTAAQMALRAHLNPALLCPRLQADDRRGAIEELLDLACRQGVVKDRDAVLEAVLRREEHLSTGLRNGIAVPHARTNEVKDVVCAIGLKPAGVDFQSADGLPARIVVLTLAPKKAGAPYLRRMALINQVLTTQRRVALLACDTAEDMYALLTGDTRGKAGLLQGLLRRGAAPAQDWLTPNRILLNLAAADKEEVLDALLETLTVESQPATRDALRQAVLEREQIMSTAIGNGVALPHARLDPVPRLLSAVAVLRKGLDFGAPDGQPVRIVVLTLIPDHGGMVYPRMLATVTRALNASGREKILAASSPREIMRILNDKP